MPISEVARPSALSRLRFHEVLRRWVAEAPAEVTIGDTGTYGQRAWLWVREAGHDYRLNVDTTRDGVVAYLALVSIYGDPLAWQIVPNRKGRANKVAFGPEKRTFPGFYFYLADDET